MQTKTYRVPATFWFDHADRSPCDHESEMAQLVERRGNLAVIQANEVQLRNLLDDAHYYADPEDGPDMLPPGLRASAKATVASIERQS